MEQHDVTVKQVGEFSITNTYLDPGLEKNKTDSRKQDEIVSCPIEFTENSITGFSWLNGVLTNVIHLIR